MHLTKVEIQNGMEDIDQYMFLNCVNLTDLTIPVSIKYLLCAFENCKALTKIVIPHPQVKHIYECAFCECESLSSITIPDSVTTIGDYAFEGCNNLETIRIPKNVKSIDLGNFTNCTSLQKVYISKDTMVGHIGYSMGWKPSFRECQPNTEIIRY